MSKKPAVPSIQPVRPLDPAWRIKFKSLKETGAEKSSTITTRRRNIKGNSR